MVRLAVVFSLVVALVLVVLLCGAVGGLVLVGGVRLLAGVGLEKKGCGNYEHVLAVLLLAGLCRLQKKGWVTAGSRLRRGLRDSRALARFQFHMRN